MININWEELCEAIGDYTKTHHYFLNKKTGEILILSEYMSDSAKSEIKKKTTGTQFSDYVLIPTLDSRESFRMMEEFVKVVSDNKLKQQLTDALSKEAPFKEFKEIVFSHPEERRKWIEFHSKKLMEQAQTWLKQIGVN
jgi:hypothetical protein